MQYTLQGLLAATHWRKGLGTPLHLPTGKAVSFFRYHAVCRTRISIQIDVGFADVVTPYSEIVTFPTLLDAPAPRLRCYPRETVVAGNKGNNQAWQFQKVLAGAGTLEIAFANQMKEQSQDCRYRD